MSYEHLTHRRMPYDIDGSAMYYKVSLANNSSYDIQVSTPASSGTMAELNDEDLVNAIGSLNNYTQGNTKYINLWLFFPEKREIEAMVLGAITDTNLTIVGLEGSNDTTNGVDGTWEIATFPSGTPAVLNPISTIWRTGIKAVSFSTSYKTIRMLLKSDYSGPGSYDKYIYLRYLHIYGRKAFGEFPDDLLFTDTSGNELGALLDWGERIEGTTTLKSFKVKNASLTKTANGVNLQLNHSDYGLSFSESGPWSATLDIASISPNTLSNTIYVKNTLGAPPLVLGPRASRCISTVTSWT